MIFKQEIIISEYIKTLQMNNSLVTSKLIATN